jgi:hypothetical protein
VNGVKAGRHGVFSYVQFYFWADAALRGNEFYPTIFLF